jgi:hypothetical protein
MYSWVTASSDAFFTQFISDTAVVDQFFQTQKKRLRETYGRASALLKKHQIPFSPANAGVFVWLDISAYLKYFEGKDEPGHFGQTGDESREIKLCRYLINNGLFIAPGEVSRVLIP